MKKVRNLVTASALMVAMGITSFTVFAAAKYDSPKEAVSGITGLSIEEVDALRIEEGQTYGEIAEAQGVLEAFKEELLEQKKEVLERRVAEERITQEKADEILARMAEQSLNCEGRENAQGMMFQGEGLAFGEGKGLKNGEGAGLQNGEGYGEKRGTGLQNGEGAGNGPLDGTGHGMNKGQGRNR